MIKSMTGFGKAEVAIPDKKITVEIRTLNSKQLDLAVICLRPTGPWNTKSGLWRRKLSSAVKPIFTYP